MTVGTLILMALAIIWLGNAMYCYLEGGGVFYPEKDDLYSKLTTFGNVIVSLIVFIIIIINWDTSL